MLWKVHHLKVVAGIKIIYTTSATGVYLTYLPNDREKNALGYHVI